MSASASDKPGDIRTIASHRGRMKSNKNVSPQASIDGIWKRFSKQKFGQIVNVIPHDIGSTPLNNYQPNRLLQDDYARAAAECRRRVEKIVDECKRVNMRYRDLSWDLDWDFKNEKGDCLNSLDQQNYDLSSLSLSSSEDKAPKAVKRVHQIFEQPTFMERIQGDDIRQGNLSNCWLMAGLVALAGIPAAVKQSCVSYDTKIGVYGFVFYRDGEWIYSIVDDKLYLKSPCWDSPSTHRDLLEQVGRDGTETIYRKTYQTGSKSLFFGQCKDQNETWVPLIEKAYAKAHGDYSSLAGGWTGEGLEDLTGGVTTELATSDILDTDEFWHREMSKVNKDFIFGASTGYLENGHGERDGIAEAHAYIVLEARSLKNGQRLVKMRNPWGDSRKGIWEGPWSDGSREWTGEIQQELGHKFGSDSVFWISYEDLIRKFSLLDRTRLFQDPDWWCCQRWVGVEVPWKANYREKFQIKVTQSSPLVVVVSQLDRRYFRGLQGQYSFRLHFRLHSQDDPGVGSYIARSHGNYLMDRSVSIDIPSVSPGTYHVYVKVMGERDPSADSVEEVIRRECLERADNQKLIQVGQAYNLAHEKASLHTSKIVKLRQEESLRRASESRRNERRREWTKRRARRQALKSQRKKNLEKSSRQGLETERAIPGGSRSGGEFSGERRSHLIHSGAEEVESNSRRPHSVVSSEKIRTGSCAESVLFENTDSSLHVSLQKLSLQPPNDTEEKPSVIGDTVGRGPSQLGRKWTWSRKQDLPSPRMHALPLLRKNDSARSLQGAGEGAQPLYQMGGDSSDSPVDDWEALYSSDDMTHKPRDAEIGRALEAKSYSIQKTQRWRKLDVSSSEDLSDSEEESLPDPWNAVCTVGVRVYSKDRDLMLLTVEDGTLLEEVRVKRPM
ncbi:hypothetical protein FDECE_8795 [Fusarium decemcellulare]|nr:hypothetical protein FDECE_8795 [Fusarium decemcellulare]